MSATDKSDAPKTKKRTYDGHVQAEVYARTRQRIVEAAMALYAESWIDQITLDQVAQRAGVTIQTVIRHFGTKEALLSAAGQQQTETETQRRVDVPVGDLDQIVAYLLHHYETQGNQVLRGLAQEGRYPMLAVFMEEGRIQHRAWVERAFGPYLEQRPGADRERLLAQLVAVCDVYTWMLLRRQANLSLEQTALSIRELLLGVITNRSG